MFVCSAVGFIAHRTFTSLWLQNPECYGLRVRLAAKQQIKKPGLCILADFGVVMVIPYNFEYGSTHTGRVKALQQAPCP